MKKSVDANYTGSLRETYSFTTSNKFIRRIVHGGDNADPIASTRIRVDGASLDADEDARAVFDQAWLRSLRRYAPRSNHYPPIRVADLFSGCGGLSLGAREACYALRYSFESTFAADHDIAALSVYERNFKPIVSEHNDIEDVVSGGFGEDLTESEHELTDSIGGIDILLAGPPCQGHSDLNNHTRRNDDRNQLYERVGRFAEIVRPGFILIENVPTVVHGQGGALVRTLEHLDRLGYEVYHDIVDLSVLGVPQVRKRHVVSAALDLSVSVKDVLKMHAVPANRTVRWAIADLEQAEGSGVLSSASKHNQDNLKRIAHLFKNDLYDLPNDLRPRCHRSEAHSYNSMYGRLKFDHPAQTITSGFVSPGQGRFIHPSQKRTLTPHEAARLQFFPDFFDFSSVSRRTALAAMIGNAVPMKLSYAFVIEYLTAHEAEQTGNSAGQP